MKIENFKVLAEKLDTETLLDFFKKEGIQDEDYFKNCFYIDENGCQCGCKEIYKMNFDYLYKYNEDTKKLEKCSENDDDVIYDFVFYVCKGCNKVSYYIEY